MGGGEKWLRSIVMLCLAAACGGRTSDQGFDDESAGTSSGGRGGQAVAPAPGGSSSGGSGSFPTPVPGYGGAPAPSAGMGAAPWGGLAGYFGGGAYAIGGYANGGAYAGGGAPVYAGAPGYAGYGAYPAGGYGGGWYTQICDIPHGTPGCSDPGVTACVCSYDSFCCDQWWAEFCVRYANMYCYF